MKIFPELWGKGEWAGASHIIADKGYDFPLIRQLIREKGKNPAIPRRKGAICPGVQDKQKYQLCYRALLRATQRKQENGSAL